MILQSPGETAFVVFNTNIYWYSITMLIAMITGIFLVSKYSYKFGLEKDFWLENSPLMIILGIIFARLYYCLANFDYYITSPLEIFNIRGGGISIHGAIIGGIIYLFILAKIKKINFWILTDSISFILPLCQSLGRWGNFFNSEAFGIPTNGEWGLYIPRTNRPSKYLQYDLFHPTFFYEAFLDIIIFILLAYLVNKNTKNGTIFLTYLISYSLVRIFVEQLRTDSAAYIFNIPLAQVISILIILFSIITLLIRKQYN